MEDGTETRGAALEEQPHSEKEKKSEMRSVGQETGRGCGHGREHLRRNGEEGRLLRWPGAQGPGETFPRGTLHTAVLTKQRPETPQSGCGDVWAGG